MSCTNNKSVLISIQPQWCELIADGKKTMEVRKTKPKLQTPFKVFIYCTKEKNIYETLWTCGVVGKFSDKANGRIIGEFVCDTIECVGIPYPAYSSELDRRYTEKSCINYSTLHEYCGHGDLYFWHISNLQIYDEPILLADFKGGLKRPPQSWYYINEEE